MRQGPDRSIFGFIENIREDANIDLNRFYREFIANGIVDPDSAKKGKDQLVDVTKILILDADARRILVGDMDHDVASVAEEILSVKVETIGHPAEVVFDAITSTR